MKESSVKRLYAVLLLCCILLAAVFCSDADTFLHSFFPETGAASQVVSLQQTDRFDAELSESGELCYDDVFSSCVSTHVDAAMRMNVSQSEGRSSHFCVSYFLAVLLKTAQFPHIIVLLLLVFCIRRRVQRTLLDYIHRADGKKEIVFFTL